MSSLTLRERYEVWLETVGVDVIASRRLDPLERTGEAFVTHHVPPFTAVAVSPAGERLEQAACGVFIAADAIAPQETAPTCRRCRIVLEIGG